MSNEGPSWLGIGAQRCGTTWFADLLVQHPQMAVAEKKKEHHWLYRYGLTREWSPAAREEYRAAFTSNELKLGEFTPYYLRASWICELTADALPADCPILVLVRDPIDRFASALRHEMAVAIRRYRAYSRGTAKANRRVKGGSPGLGLRVPIAGYDRLRKALRRRMTAGVLWVRGAPKKPLDVFGDTTWLKFVGSDASWGGMYATQLDAWTAVLPEERFIVIQYEKLREDPQRYTDLVWKRLGLEPVRLTEIDRVSASPKYAKWLLEDHPQVVRALQKMYRPDAEQLASRFDIDLALWKRTMTDA